MPGDFFDTNVLVYLASGEPKKAAIAERLIAGGGAISVQVINEFANVARGKMGLSWKETREFLATLRELLIVHPVSVETHETGLALARRYSLSIYDAMIAASALLAGGDRVFSQDMQHGMTLKEGLKIVDPFRAPKLVGGCRGIGPLSVDRTSAGKERTADRLSDALRRDALLGIDFYKTRHISKRPLPKFARSKNDNINRST